MAKSVDLVYDRLIVGDKIKSSDKYEAQQATHRRGPQLLPRWPLRLVPHEAATRDSESGAGAEAGFL
jgi:hypothetical protein